MATGAQPDGSYIDPESGLRTYKGEAGPRFEADVPSHNNHFIMDPSLMDRARRYPNANARGDTYRANEKVSGSQQVPSLSDTLGVHKYVGDQAPLMGRSDWNMITEDNAMDLDQAPYRIGSGDEYARGGRPRLALGGLALRPPQSAMGNRVMGQRPPGQMRPMGARPMGLGAATMSHQKPIGLADGGYSAPYPPFYERAEARNIQDDAYHPGGLIESDAAGRTDRLPYSVAADSFVMPADVVSGLGQGNTLAGAKILDAATHTGPFGTQLPKGARGRGPGGGNFAQGGAPQADAPVSHVMLAGGEYLVPRDRLVQIGRERIAARMTRARTPLAAGHEWAREFVDRVRKHSKKFLAKAPDPKR